MSKEAREGIRPHIQRLLELGVLVPCQSSWNTPLLPVKKPGFVTLGALLYSLTKETETFSWTPIHQEAFKVCILQPKTTSMSQVIFAFEWRDPDSGQAGQITWTRLPQGFKNSSTLFDESLPRDLVLFGSEKTQISLLQYVDDLLLAATTEQEARLGTEKLLAELSELGYKASAKKAQLCQAEVTYLGYTLRGRK